MPHLNRLHLGPVPLVAGVLAAHLAFLAGLADRPLRATVAATREPGPSMRVVLGDPPRPPPTDPPAAPPGPAARHSPALAPPPRTTDGPGRPWAGAQVPSGGHPAPGTPDPVAFAGFRPPPAFHVDFEVRGERRGHPVEGRASLSWQPLPDGRYQAVMHTRIAGTPPHLQESTGQLRAEGLAPSRFSDRRRSEHAAHFDAERRRFVFSRSGPQPGWRAGAQDPVSALVQLAGMAAANPAIIEPGREVVLQVAGTHEAGEWRFVSQGTETLATPEGPLPAVRLVRPPLQAFDWQVEAWLAPSRDYGPVRLRLTQADGDWLDHLWPGTDKR